MIAQLKSLFNITVTAEYIILIAAIFLLHKKHNGIWRLFILLLLVIVLSETAGWYIGRILHKPNAWVFNINLLITDVFVLWLLSAAEPMIAIKNILLKVIAIFILLAIGNLLFFEGFWKYNRYTEVLADIVIASSCYWLFYTTINEEKYRDILRYEYFWMANGFFLSSLGSAIVYIFPDTIAAYKRNTGVSLYAIINYITNIVLYSNLLIAFICRNRNTKLLEEL